VDLHQLFHTRRLDPRIFKCSACRRRPLVIDLDNVHSSHLLSFNRLVHLLPLLSARLRKRDLIKHTTGLLNKRERESEGCGFRSFSCRCEHSLFLTSKCQVARLQSQLRAKGRTDRVDSLVRYRNTFADLHGTCASILSVDLTTTPTPPPLPINLLPCPTLPSDHSNLLLLLSSCRVSRSASDIDLPLSFQASRHRDCSRQSLPNDRRSLVSQLQVAQSHALTSFHYHELVSGRQRFIGT
jgi:hypothetical protein